MYANIKSLIDLRLENDNELIIIRSNESRAYVVAKEYVEIVTYPDFKGYLSFEFTDIPTHLSDDISRHRIYDSLLNMHTPYHNKEKNHDV